MPGRGYTNSATTDRYSGKRIILPSNDHIVCVCVGGGRSIFLVQLTPLFFSLAMTPNEIGKTHTQEPAAVCLYYYWLTT